MGVRSQSEGKDGKDTVASDTKAPESALPEEETKKLEVNLRVLKHLYRNVQKNTLSKQISLVSWISSLMRYIRIKRCS